MISSYFLLDSTPRPRLPYVAYSRMERYRYDPLGRRVWREMIRDTLNGICQAQDKSSGCRNEVTRTVWDGDQVLWDIRATADTVGESSEGYPTGSTFTGRVGYTHAGGIDTPLEINTPSGVVLPIADWRGQYAAGTCPGTKCDPNSYYFPGAQGSAFEEPVPLPTGPPRWIGELVTGMADGSGYQYKRNRYFSPSSGRFTQEDPIGLGGGLNSYGFGGGDPISFSDPFGLCGPFMPVCVAAAAIGPAVGTAVVRGSQLVRNLAASGAVRQAGEAAHHIVARGARLAEPARAKLAEVGVGVDEAVNGVILPAVRNYAGAAANHLTLHTKEYYSAVNNALQNANTRERALEVLSELAAQLKNGTIKK